MSDCIYIKQDLIAFNLCHVLLFRKTKHQQNRKKYLNKLLMGDFSLHLKSLAIRTSRTRNLILKVGVEGNQAVKDGANVLPSEGMGDASLSLAPIGQCGLFPRLLLHHQATLPEMIRRQSHALELSTLSAKLLFFMALACLGVSWQ